MLIFGWILIVAMFIVFGALAFAPFILSGRIADQEERAELAECPGEAPPVVYGDAPEAVDAAEMEAIEADLDETLEGVPT
jgi:hypothetical protein